MAKKETGSKAPKKAVSFSIDETVEREFRASCILSGKKPWQVIEDLIRNYVKQNQAKATKA